MLILGILCALADTFGLPPPTPIEREWRFDGTKAQEPGVACARTPDEWAGLWSRTVPGEEKPPVVDFERLMVVGIVGGKGKPLRSIYRIELDDAAKSGTLMVRCAPHSAGSLIPKDVDYAGAALHLVATPRSALPVRFVLDEMVDGRLFHLNGGVEESLLGEAKGVAAEGVGIAWREQAEGRVRASLTDAEIADLKKTVRPRLHGARYPQLWSLVSVAREKDRWAVTYDGLKFEVDAATGEVRRP